MARVTGPLLAFSAAGQIAKTQVYGSWKGIPYARRYVTPSNPRSTEQTETRNVFSFLNNVFKVAPADFVAPWTEYSRGRPFTNRNAFIAKDLPVLRGMADLTGFIMSPGAKGGLVPDVAVSVAVAHHLTITVTPPAVLPSGWSVVKAVGAILKQQDPSSGTDYDISVLTDNTDPFTLDFTGLTTGDHWMAGAWLVYQRSSLATDLAFSPATASEETIT